jgi:hypothetical protein
MTIEPKLRPELQEPMQQAKDVLAAVGAELLKRGHAVKMQPEKIAFAGWERELLQIDGIGVGMKFDYEFVYPRRLYNPDNSRHLIVCFDSVCWHNHCVLSARTYKACKSGTVHGFNIKKIADRAVEEWLHKRKQQAEQRVAEMAKSVKKSMPDMSGYVVQGKTGLGLYGINDGLSVEECRELLTTLRTILQKRVETKPESEVR